VDAAAQPTSPRDFQIASDIVASVNRYPHFTIFDDVSVKVERGVTTLFGKVTMPYKRTEIEKLAARVDGVVEVSNEITVLPVSRFDDELRQRIARSIYGDSNFRAYAMLPNPPIHIIVERSHVTLTGVVRSEVDRALARALATQFGAFSVTNDLRTDDEVLDAELRRDRETD
jgi:osmotically-inducible protein OsmY